MPILRCALGILFFLVVAWLLSSDRRRINVRVVVGGLLLQVFLAYFILETDLGRQSLDTLSSGVTTFLSFSNEGTKFVFGSLADADAPAGFVFAFQVLPTIIYFSALMAILYHVGVIQVVIWLLAKVMTSLLRVSGAESLAMAANVFIGQTEAPFVIRPYIEKMTRSELMSLMCGGFATMAGSVLTAYLKIIGTDMAGHLLAASFMSAPAAFMMAKVLQPETEEPVTRGSVEFRFEKSGASNLFDAAATGTADGLKLALNVGAILISFKAIIAVVDWPLIEWFGITLKEIFGTVFSPVAWMMGVEWNDCETFGSLLGTKVAATEMIAYQDLGVIRAKAAMSLRSQQMAAYALCGFANFASIGIQIGGIGVLTPSRRQDLSKLAFRAMIGGAFASWITATIAGAFL